MDPDMLRLFELADQVRDGLSDNERAMVDFAKKFAFMPQPTHQALAKQTMTRLVGLVVQRLRQASRPN